jgi:hypothetical protein
VFKGLPAAILAATIPLSAFAQSPLTGDQIGEIEKEFLSGAGRPSFDCQFRFYHPALNFNLGFEAAYVVTVSYERVHPPRTLPDVILRVTSKTDNREREYFVSRNDASNVSVGRSTYKMGGRFAVSTGAHRVEAFAIDDLGRVCRAEWQVDVPPQRSRATPISNRTIKRISVFLDAAPLNWRFSGLQATDTPLLVEALSALIRELPAEFVRLVVFNLDLQSEFFRSDSFHVKEIDGVRQAIAAMQLREIDYTRLRSLQGPAVYLGSLIRRETHEPTSSPAVIFLGPLARSGQVFPKGFAAIGGTASQFFYVQYRDNLLGPPNPNGAVDNNASMGAGLGFPAPPSPAASLRDTIASAIGRLGGATFIVSSPDEFSRALKQLRQRLAP